MMEPISQITVTSNKNNEPVIIEGNLDKLYCVGIGTDAAVFRSYEIPQYAFKVFATDKLFKKDMELNVYERIGESSFFPSCYGQGHNFIVLSYEEGITLYDAVVKGIHIPPQVIEDVEQARKEIYSKGMNPRDIHLKNVIMNEGRAKLIDVSEYMKEGDDGRWAYLKRGYKDYYHLIDGKAIPIWMVESVRKWYNIHSAKFDYREFTEKMVKLFKIKE
ncbi:serine/threonine protein kinase [Cytobacillus sp. FJAT-54145]|uniref:Serine/threonine protein kinase n=1 Tax=Cytobacillus spartinae TaxID=3299023 RepID=A0ABW6K7L6_9BACI